MNNAGSNRLLYYHSIPFSQVSYSELVSDPKFSQDEDLKKAYAWVAKQIGFWPIFLAAGKPKAVYVTGYCNQWRCFLGSERSGDRWVRRYRKAGESANEVLFAFDPASIVEPVFTEFTWWCISMNATMNGQEPDARTRRYLFMKWRSREHWHKAALKKHYALQVLTPRLDLRKAEFAWVRNQTTARKMREMGFENVIVRRIPVEIPTGSLVWR